VVGEYADWGVTLRNQGETEGIVSEIKGLPKGAVSLVDPSPLPWIIPPHGVRCITFRYAPDLPGTKLAGHLTLTTNDPDFPDQEVWLSGIGMGLRPQLDGSPPEIANSLRMAFRYVPAGTYLMGSPEHEPGRNDDEVPHTVSLTRGFYLQTTPVTQGQWQALMGSNPMSLENCDPDCPVEQVSWHDCQGFINRLNALGEGRYRLPTEAEWEYASRAGSPMAFALGEITALFCAHDPSLDRMGWYCGNSDWQSHPVARKAPNAWGLYDMHGNVYEWCQDWYGEYPGSSDTDPEGPASGARKVIRGGSCFSSVKTCRSAARSSWAPQEKAPFLGLRLVREI
jgi:formylglycine-generating enzyme required for sulfatase activity